LPIGVELAFAATRCAAYVPRCGRGAVGQLVPSRCAEVRTLHST
jgi:hypothetical protein